MSQIALREVGRYSFGSVLANLNPSFWERTNTNTKGGEEDGGKQPGQAGKSSNNDKAVWGENPAIAGLFTGSPVKKKDKKKTPYALKSQPFYSYWICKIMFLYLNKPSVTCSNLKTYKERSSLVYWRKLKLELT